ncbi:hypothetical protein [Pseudonocardia acaciae]|uniref:hypothetical protein n=1 Tax=Pseudonocardia acaciae TaxID=551276 RepID=UPI0004921205|nr:hypothetical protein [Pseudonocardia acaciae]
MSLHDEVAADAAIDRLAAEHQAMFERLMRLHDHTGRKLLDAGVLHGQTERRWAVAREDLARMWAFHRAHGEVVATARHTRGRRARPSGRDLAALERLLTESTAVRLPDSERSVSVPDLVAEFRVLERDVRAVLDAADQVWAVFGPCIDQCEELLTSAAATAAEVGLADSDDVAGTSLVALGARLDELRAIGLSDPLSRWTPARPDPRGASPAGAVDRAGVDELVADCRRAQAALAELDELRRASTDRLDRVEAALSELEELERQAVICRAEVALKIAGPPPPEPDPSLAAALRAGIAEARQLRAVGRWRELSETLAGLHERAERAPALASAALDTLREPLRIRRELRARLELYRVKADTDGRTEDLPLERAYRAAYDLLWTAPCDLAVAARHVDEYLHLVNRTGPAQPHGGDRA